MIIFQKASSLSVSDNIMSDSCVNSRNLLHIARKQSVRFAGEPDIKSEVEIARDEDLNSTSIIEMKDTNSGMIEGNTTNAPNEVNSEQLVTVNSVLNKINELDIEITLKKKSNHEGTSRKFLFMLSDEIMAFIAVY